MRLPVLTPIEQKAATTRDAIVTKWDAKTEPTLKQERDGYVLHIQQVPSLMENKRGENTSVHFRVRLFDPKGSEVRIDPDRVISNPPQQIVISRAVYETDEKGEAVLDKDGEPILLQPRVLELNPEAAIWEALWQSVLAVPGVVR